MGQITIGVFAPSLVGVDSWENWQAQSQLGPDKQSKAILWVACPDDELCWLPE